MSNRSLRFVLSTLEVSFSIGLKGPSPLLEIECDLNGYEGEHFINKLEF